MQLANFQRSSARLARNRGRIKLYSVDLPGETIHVQSTCNSRAKVFVHR